MLGSLWFVASGAQSLSQFARFTRYQPQRPAQSTPIPSTAESAVARNGGHLSSFGGDSSPAAQAFLRSQWPWLAALGFGAAGALAYSVFREPAVTQRVWLEFGVDGQPVGVVVVGLHGGDAPHTADNFEALACHSPGFGYAGVPVHRVMHGWSVWSGDVTQGDGSGGVSAYGASLPLESWGAKHRRGTLSMVLDEDSRLRSQLGDALGCNTGKSVQHVGWGRFFFTLVTTPALDRKAAAIGRVLEGLEVLDRISRLPTCEGQEGRPKQDVRILRCGVVEEQAAHHGEKPAEQGGGRASAREGAGTGAAGGVSTAVKS
ncbi:hypothetical protein CHLRE_12g544113v5 [Chlamydomonas reinhardtii]|uniref:PPIase cyclophilin-type domain-containing protein n=1 Tax=Chlamydomonas reinhardtii TaxID=3055 RepID=A0A2K3D6N9_CHLRE|nr:uncharacterized protein CHLRE_12g544113v5 [Chlamydomonas reinhardtii]PNW76198.1 hypothetical protein CHLRE_12g544113v5 [Chlamydomonas reinhardtii]